MAGRAVLHQDWTDLVFEELLCLFRRWRIVSPKQRDLELVRQGADKQRRASNQQERLYGGVPHTVSIGREPFRTARHTQQLQPRRAAVSTSKAQPSKLVPACRCSKLNADVMGSQESPLRPKRGPTHTESRATFNPRLCPDAINLHCWPQLTKLMRVGFYDA